MFYAASEIVFWILLSAIIGGGIGYGLSQAKSVQLGKRLTESRADAPMERELAIAWDTIEDLNKRLQVAHETIRGGVVANAAAADPDQLLAVDDPAPDPADGRDEAPEDATAEDAMPEDGTPESRAPEGEAPEVAAPGGELPSDDDAELAAPLTHTVEEVTRSEEPTDDGDEASDGVVGSRLSDRVASASIGNQVEVIKTVEF